MVEKWSLSDLLVLSKGAIMAKDVMEIVEDYVSADQPRRWNKLASTIDSRRLELLLLREILAELRKLNAAKQSS